jgi:hypothetical protein
MEGCIRCGGALNIKPGEKHFYVPDPSMCFVMQVCENCYNDFKVKFPDIPLEEPRIIKELKDIKFKNFDVTVLKNGNVRLTRKKREVTNEH